MHLRSSVYNMRIFWSHVCTVPELILMLHMLLQTDRYLIAMTQAFGPVVMNTATCWPVTGHPSNLDGNVMGTSFLM